MPIKLPETRGEEHIWTTQQLDELSQLETSVKLLQRAGINAELTRYWVRDADETVGCIHIATTPKE